MLRQREQFLHEDLLKVKINGDTIPWAMRIKYVEMANAFLADMYVEKLDEWHTQ